MKHLVTIPAHYDGTAIVLDVPHELRANDKLLVTILQSETEDREREDWLALSLLVKQCIRGRRSGVFSLTGKGA